MSSPYSCWNKEQPSDTAPSSSNAPQSAPQQYQHQNENQNELQENSFGWQADLTVALFIYLC